LRAIRTLACLVTAQRILTIKEFQISVSLEAGLTKIDTLSLPDEGELVDSCFGLVVMDDNTNAAALRTLQPIEERKTKRSGRNA
jgi:hypothetical protein